MALKKSLSTLWGRYILAHFYVNKTQRRAGVGRWPQTKWIHVLRQYSILTLRKQKKVAIISFGHINRSNIYLKVGKYSHLFCSTTLHLVIRHSLKRNIAKARFPEKSNQETRHTQYRHRTWLIILETLTLMTLVSFYMMTSKSISPRLTCPLGFKCITTRLLDIFIWLFHIHFGLNLRDSIV